MDAIQKKFQRKLFQMLLHCVMQQLPYRGGGAAVLLKIAVTMALIIQLNYVELAVLSFVATLTMPMRATDAHVPIMHIACSLSCIP